MQEHNISIVPIPYTRVTSTTISSIDLCYTNLAHEDLEVKVLRNTISDHFGVINGLGNFNPQPHRIKMCRPITEQTLNGIKANLSRQEWSEVFIATTVTINIRYLHRLLLRNSMQLYHQPGRLLKTRLPKPSGTKTFRNLGNLQQ